MAKTKYDPKTFPKRAEEYAKEGMIEAQIAKKLGVSVATFETYKNRFPEFLASLKKGKAPVDEAVENALLKRALGYEYTEEKETESEKDGKKKELMHKHQPPDTTAMIFWLKNRKPAVWRDKQDIEHTGKDGAALTLTIVDPRKKEK